MNVLRSLTFSFAFYGKIASLSIFERIQEFFWKNPSVFPSKKADFWMFCEILLFHSHSSENLLPVAIFKKYSFFRKTHLFPEQMPEFSTVLRNLTCSLAFYSRFATLSDFSKKTRSFSKNSPFFSIEKP